MVRYIIIGLIVIGLVCSLGEMIVTGISYLYVSITSTHKEVIEAIDKGNLSEAKELLPDAKIEERYRCALLLIDEYVAIEDTKNAVYVFERITPKPNNVEYWEEMLYKEYAQKAKETIYWALIKNGNYKSAWKYHEQIEFYDLNDAIQGQHYCNYMMDVIDHLCENGKMMDAQLFLDEQVVWFRQHVDRTLDAEKFPEYSYRKMKNKLQNVLDEYKIGVTE